MNSCAPAEVLSQLLGGALTDERIAILRAHLADCPQCQALLDQLSDKSGLLDWASSCRSLRWPPADEPELDPLLGKLRANHSTEPYLGRSGPETAAMSLRFLAPPEREGDLG